MSLHHINVVHRMVKARQDNKLASVVSDTSASQSSVSTPLVSSTPPPVSTSSTKQASSTTPLSTSTRTTASIPPETTFDEKPSTTATSTSTTSSSSSSSSSSSAVSSNSSSSSSSSTSGSASSVSSTATKTSLATTSTTARAVLGQSTVRTGTFSSIAGESTITANPINTATPSGGLSTGAIVGSVAGGIIGVAILGFIIAFVLRRWRRRSIQDQFPDLHDYPDVGSSPFDSPAMAQRGHITAPSIGGGPGMAGYGAYTSATGGASTDSATSTGAVLQERPQYVFGQDLYNQNTQTRDDVSDHAHGAYSSEPQPQAVYNPEAYGSYALYDNPATGYQDATREYQGQHGYPGQYNYVVDAAPSSPPAGAYQVQNNSSRGHGPSRSIVADDDVYGGI